MRKTLGMLLLAALALAAQTVETIPFRAVLSTANEVPAITDLNASGSATVWVHVMRDASGQVVSGSVDFNVRFDFPGETTFTGLHIHRGEAGVNGPVTVNSGISGAQPMQHGGGRGNVQRQGQVRPTDTAGLDTLRGLLQNPGGYYVNLHTTVNPGGAVRGQLQRAEMVVLMGMMSPRNEIPAIADLAASGVGSVIALATRDGAGALTSGEVIFDVNYANFPDGTAFTGLHIHTGRANVNGPVTINSGISGGANAVPLAPGSNLHYEVDVPLTNAAAAATLEGLFRDPTDFYINLHTVVNPGGAIRAQLRNTDRMRFQTSMLPSNEVPAVTGLDAGANAELTLHTLRAADGSVAAGTVIFDVNHRFAERAQFTGLHIHDGTATESGPVRINTGIVGTNPVISETGFGNIYKVVNVSAATGIATLNSLVKNPENHYVNLHTTDNPGGAVRAQVMAATTAMPTVAAIINSVSDVTLRTVGQGGLMTIFGRNLFKVPADLSGFESGVASRELNGTDVTVGGTSAPIVWMGREANLNPPDFVVVQVPFEATPGPQSVTVRNSNGAGPAATATVAAVAPGVYFDGLGGVAIKLSDYTLVRPSNPARAGDMLAVLSTGLGQTTPALATGQSAPAAPVHTTATVTATIGGRDAQVMSSYAVPNFLGFYFTVVQVPTGLTAGNQPLALRIGGTNSNTVMVAVN